MTTADSSSFGTNQNNNKEHIVHLLLLQLRTIWENLKLNGNILLHRIGAYEIIEKVAQLSAKHPYLALIISCIIAILLLPFLIIFGFALSTVVLTFTGFILVEGILITILGTLITIASVLLFGCLSAVFLVFLFFGGMTLVSYLGFMHIFDLYNGYNKTAMENFLKKEKSKTT